MQRAMSSKRKAPQGENPNKDICDMLMGKWGSTLLIPASRVACYTSLSLYLYVRTFCLREKRREKHPQSQRLQVNSTGMTILYTIISTFACSSVTEW